MTWWAELLELPCVGYAADPTRSGRWRKRAPISSRSVIGYGRTQVDRSPRCAAAAAKPRSRGRLTKAAAGCAFAGGGRVRRGPAVRSIGAESGGRTKATDRPAKAAPSDRQGRGTCEKRRPVPSAVSTIDAAAPAAAAKGGAPDLAFGAFQRGYFLTAFALATQRADRQSDTEVR